MNYSIFIVFLGLIMGGVLMGLIRMLKGPTASDRAVAVDAITTTTVALLVILAFIFKRYVYVEVSLVYALLSFVGLCAIARFLEKGF
ncbi:MAG: cation:proton antiporter [Candidatus Marinimicrobia bacterium CG08_land_8_20_14_0_20_45_22]|nr:MAG: cation:proton antiporter [Candidatus Marinimicrobia bacterium CG08_land_8_20_14_0_20_45_22]